MGNVSKIKIGACDVSWGGIPLGLTKGGVSLTIATTKHDTTVDQQGASAIDSWLVGRTLTAKIPMVETTVEKLAFILGKTGGVLANGQLGVGTGNGISLFSGAVPLVLHPTALPDYDHSEDITVPLAATTGDVQFTYSVDNERVFEIDFTAFAPGGASLFTYGGSHPELPSDVVANGGTFMAGATALPAGLSSNGGLIMTDGSVIYSNTVNNGGVLMAAA